MTKLRAVVSRVTGATRHGIASIQDGRVVESVQSPDPAWVEISEQDGLYFLLRYNKDGNCIADTCHLTVTEAKEQAHMEFDISTSDWAPID
jgi:hypothetical protein